MTKNQLNNTTVELRFLVPPGFVEAARLAMAPYCLDEATRKQSDVCRPGKARRCPGLTAKELQVLLRD